MVDESFYFQSVNSSYVDCECGWQLYVFELSLHTPTQSKSVEILFFAHATRITEG